jgi:anti-anti-sigma factor
LSLALSNEKQNERIVTRVKGILDISTVDLFTEHTIHLFGELGGHRILAVDFSGLEFIDSTGIGVILEFIYESKERGLAVRFEGIHEEIAEIFETIGVMRVLEAMLGDGP